VYKVGVRKNAGEGDGEEAEVLRGLQGCLAHNKTNPPRNLPQAFAKSPRGVLGGGCFLMGEVPLYIEALNEPTLCNLNTIAGSTQGPSHFNQKSIRKNLASFGEKCPQMAPRRNPFLQKGALGQPSKGLAWYSQGGGGKARLLRGLYLR